MSDEPTPSAAGYLPPPISDHEQRLMISVELGTIRGLVASGAFTVEGLQSLNHRLILPAAPGRADAHMSALREVVVAELHARLVAATGVPIEYWAYAHQVAIPDDASGLDRPREDR